MARTDVYSHPRRPVVVRWTLLLLLFALGAGLPAPAAADKIPGVGLDFYPGRPDPFPDGVFDRDAFFARYGEHVERRQYWPGMVAELFPINELALRNACLAGVLGDPAIYDCNPKMVEQHDLAKATRRPSFYYGLPSDAGLPYEPDNFYCKWWLNTGPTIGVTPQNPIQVSDPTRPAGPFSAPPKEGWACPLYYVNTPPDVEEPACVQNNSTLCLGGNRFKVEVAWQTSQGTSGVGQATRLTTDTGTFAFFESTNLELMVKVLDGCTANQKFWVFAGGLTNVRVELKVTDTETGAEKLYVNPLSNPYQPLQDTSAFSCP
jgi:hypothetical protein